MKMNSHLNSVNESYFQHMRHALGFTVELFLGAACCLVHAFLPFMFENTGSKLVSKLHNRMVINRANLSPAKSVNANSANSALSQARSS